MSVLFDIIKTVFKGSWVLLTSFNIYGVNPCELAFACTLLLFVIRKVIRPVFGGDKSDSD